MSDKKATIDQLQAALDFFANVSEVIEERQGQYAGPVENYARIKAGWDQIFGIDIPVKKIPLAMVWLKVARQINAVNTDQPNDDDWNDIAGYASNGYILSEQERVDKRKADLATANYKWLGLTRPNWDEYQSKVYPRETKRTEVRLGDSIQKESLRLSAFGAIWIMLGYRVEYTLNGKVVGWVNPGDQTISWIPADNWTS